MAEASGVCSNCHENLTLAEFRNHMTTVERSARAGNPAKKRKSAVRCLPEDAEWIPDNDEREAELAAHMLCYDHNSDASTTSEEVVEEDHDDATGDPGDDDNDVRSPPGYLSLVPPVIILCTNIVTN